MKKIRLFLLIACLPLFSLAQNEKQGMEKIQMACGPCVVEPMKLPLYIIDDRKFNGETQQFYLDIDNISDVKFFKPDKAVNKYGDDGKNGVVVYKLKKPVEWVSLQEILDETKSGSCAPEIVVLKSDELLNSLDKSKEKIVDKDGAIYFQKDIIKELTVAQLGREEHSKKCTLMIQFTK